MGSPTAFPFDPDAVAALDFPADLSTAPDEVQAWLMATPFFGFAAAVVCEADDVDVLCEVQELVIEPVDNGTTFASGLWAPDEVIGYLNQTQDDFIQRTGIVLKRASLGYNPATHRADLPQDCILVRRVVYHDADPDARRFTPVCRGDTWALDAGEPTWEYGNKPRFPLVYSDTEPVQQTIAVGPGTLKKGVLEALYVPLGDRLSNTGVCLSVPGEFAPTLRWGVLAKMLLKVGRGQDVARGNYAASRYEEGVAAGNLMLSGWA